MEYDSKLIAGLPPEQFVKLIKMVFWALEGEQHGLELTYSDQELLVFKVKNEQKTLQ